MNIMRFSAVRTTSMMYTLARIHTGRNNPKGWRAYNKVIDGLFLGMIPIKEAAVFGTEFNNQHEKIIAAAREDNIDRPLQLVVSVVEPDELQGVGFSNIRQMVQPADWKAKGIKQHSLSIADQTAEVKNNAAIATVMKMRQCILDGGSIYIHCKAGRSRSAMMCLIYLVVYENMSLQDAKDLLIRQRQQVELDTDKMIKAAEIIEAIKQQAKTAINAVFPLDSKCLDIITQDCIPYGKPPIVKHTPNHAAGFFAGLASMLLAPMAWFHGAHQVGKEHGIFAGILAFIFMPVTWVYGGVCIGQAAAEQAATVKKSLHPDDTIKIKHIVLPDKPLAAKASSNMDAKSAGISKGSPLFDLINYGDKSPKSGTMREKPPRNDHVSTKSFHFS